VRLQLHVLAYNLANFMRTLALPEAVAQWSLTSLREKLIKIGAKVVRHARYAVFQMAEVAMPGELFEKTVRLIDGLRRRSAPAQDRTNAPSPREECVRMTRERAKSTDQKSFWARAWRKRWWNLCRPLTVSSKPGRMLAFAPSLGSICGMSAK
jgi:hypothetical protein